jgi:hypothetical protein
VTAVFVALWLHFDFAASKCVLLAHVMSVGFVDLRETETR